VVEPGEKVERAAQLVLQDSILLDTEVTEETELAEVADKMDRMAFPW
jgi:hypothetical protein